ncbi:hypothetical protein [Synechococcus sp. RS9916]|uniref:hypothetical protein n=1 Tax=Synechococcus sp. RS9916 TaxID=221359 RepID=UPI0000E538F8|nr:hypothetical protein [Synechococcus sp. RS9916]EAU74278.1 hypothetical protein RS9916_32262 [Synechococcus sp. RS9916]
MSPYNTKIGEVYVNKYGLREVLRTTTRSRTKPSAIDKLDRIWLSHPHGALLPSVDTTHVRITCDRVEPHGCWVITLGSDIVEIDNSYAGQRFDYVIPLIEGAAITTTLNGMQRENAAEIYIQELIIEDG